MDKDALRAQYNNLFSHLIEHKKHMWQIPAASATIVGILVGLAFSLPDMHWIAREMILVIGALISFSLLSSLVKHRYFSGIWLESLHEIEHELGLKRVQMTTKCKEGDYWYSESPSRRLEGRSAFNVAVNIMWVVLILLIFLLIAFPILAVTGILS